MERRVLVISNQETAAIIKQELSGSFQIITCEDEKEVLDLLEKKEVKPFLLIVSGCEMAKKVRGQISEGLNCSIIIITIISGPPTLEEILNVSPDDEIVLKDLIPLSLLSMVRFRSTGKT